MKDKNITFVCGPANCPMPIPGANIEFCYSCGKTIWVSETTKQIRTLNDKCACFECVDFSKEKIEFREPSPDQIQELKNLGFDDHQISSAYQLAKDLFEK